MRVWLTLILALFLCAGCGNPQIGNTAVLSRADQDAAVEVVRQYLEGMKNDFGVISLVVNSLQAVQNQQHIQTILSSEAAVTMGLTEEKIALVEAYLNVQYDGTKVPYNSGENQYIGFTLVRENTERPWIIASYGQGLGGVALVDFANPYPEKSAELYVWKNKELTGNTHTYFTVFDNDTNRLNKNRPESEIYNLDAASDSIDSINLRLAGIPNLTCLAVYQMNTTDFTKDEIEDIVGKLILNTDHHCISLGLWEPDSLGSVNGSHIINSLKRKGFNGKLKDVTDDLIQHPELIPYDGVLGGTMGFYFPEDIHVLTDKWVLAYFEDGHISGYMLLEYTINNDSISWRVMESYLNGE